MKSERIRGSSNIPLSDFGRQQAFNVGKKLAGRITHIHSSDLDRTRHTAAAILANNPDAKVVAVTDQLHPWHMGEHEGKPVDEVLPIMQDRIKNAPDDAMPGTSPQSQLKGESFNDFKDRALNYIKNNVVDAWRPGERHAVTTHYRNIRAMHSWVANGVPDDLSVDSDEMTKKGDSKPGDIFYYNPENRTKQLEKTDNADRPGIYFVRHGATKWNAEDKSSPGS